MNFVPRIVAKKESSVRYGPGAGGSPGAKHARLVRQTEKWVAQTFFGEMLKQMRNSPFKDKRFGGGRGGEAFQGLLDQKLADKMSRGAGGKLVASIVRHIEHAPKYGKKPKPSTLNLLAE